MADAAAVSESQLIAFSGQAPPTASSIGAGLVDGGKLFDVDAFAQASVQNTNISSSLVQDLVTLMVDGVGVTLPASVSVTLFGPYADNVERWIRAAVAPGGVGLMPLQAYLALTAAREYADLDLLGAAPREVVEAYTAVVEGLTAPPPQLTRCVKRMGKLFPTAVGQAFAGAHLPAADKAFASAMTEDVRAAASRLINQSDWLDAPTTAAIQEKLAAMRMKVGKVTPAAGPEDTSGVVMSAADYPASLLSANDRLWREQWVRAAAPPDGEVPLDATTMNAWYWRFESTAVLTAGTYEGRAPPSQDVCLRQRQE